MGCDGSILLDDTPSSTGEKSLVVNLNTTRGYEIIDKIKARLEKACPAVVSCADILAVVARDSVVGLGGPNWNVPLGRRDSTEAHPYLTEAIAPLFLAGLDAIILFFEAKGFTKNEFVALQGSHTIGMARCLTYKNHIYDDKNIDPAYAASLRANCPKQGGDSKLTPIDSTTPFVFDNMYFINLMKQKGLLVADQQLYTGKGGTADAIVANYSSSKDNFFNNYVTGIVKLGKMGVLTGKDGEIRTNCRKVNGAKA
ncbi:cationic peroxidase 1 isoform X2 [Spinacia oleracea]|uniref:peroxidase n=1 Tax=Spinacia oleracea TaxID=3562 RepID=A0ABM3QS81_SPIOL|nr:cationic peroxidase 1-like isoform X2 [Spinacia oleracea]